MARTRKPSNIPANETKEQRSIRLALMRMPKARKALSLIENLTTSGYSFTPEQRKAICDTLTGDLRRIVEKFNKTPGATTDESSFSFLT